MRRRKFIEKSFIVGAGIATGNGWINSTNFKDMIIGHNGYTYKVDLNWGALNSNYYPVKDCHEMVMDKKGRLILLTNHTKNNVIIYDTAGNLLETWGTEYPGAHGLTINDEGGEEFLYIADNSRHEVIKTDLKGKVIMTMTYPADSGKYENVDQYVPTETAIASNGDIYVADGYGLQYIMHYDEHGKLKNVFGGKGDGEEHFHNAHGICIDTRDGTEKLLITEREKNKLKRFNLNGDFLSNIDLPGAYICRPVIKDKNVYLATIWSGNKENGSGFISVLDENDRLVSAPGGIPPVYTDQGLRKMTQALKLFTHPHDVCIDKDDNIYVPQWNSGNTYPLKLTRV